MCLLNKTKVINHYSVPEMFHGSHYALRVGFLGHIDHEIYEERIRIGKYEIVNCDDDNGVRHYIHKKEEFGPPVYSNPDHGRITIFSEEELQNFLLLQ